MASPLLCQNKGVRKCSPLSSLLPSQCSRTTPPKTVNFSTIAMPEQRTDDLDKTSLLRQSWLDRFPDKVTDDAAAFGNKTDWYKPNMTAYSSNNRKR